MRTAHRVTNMKKPMTPCENLPARYIEAVSFLQNLDDDWARAIELIGPCLHDPKAAREPYGGADPCYRLSAAHRESR